MKNKSSIIIVLCAAQIVFFALISMLYLHIQADILFINPIGHFTATVWQLFGLVEFGLALPLVSWIAIIISEKKAGKNSEPRTKNKAAIIFYCVCTALCLAFCGGAFGMMLGMSGVPYTFLEYLYYIGCILTFICQIVLIVLLFKQSKEWRMKVQQCA